MDIYIKSINLDLYSVTELGGIIGYKRGRNDINYIVVNNHHKIEGTYITHQNLDGLTINEIKELIKDDFNKSVDKVRR